MNSRKAVWIIGGTSEVHNFIPLIKGKVDYIITVATYAGEEVLNGESVRVGRMNQEEMVNFCQKEGIYAIIDLSHPYAKVISEYSQKVAEKMNISYHRYVRHKCKAFEGHIFDSIKSLGDFLKDRHNQTVFFTTGVKNIEDFEPIKGNNRFVYRVLPTVFSMETCKSLGVSIKDIVAMVGPATSAINQSMMEFYKADYIVLKDSGKEGGTDDKIAAAEELGVVPLVLSRPEEEGYPSLESLAYEILRLN